MITTSSSPPARAKFGTTDYAIDSNSMFDQVGLMEEIPLRNEHGNAAFLRDVATPKDANFIQTNVVRVNGKRQVYVPVFRQFGRQHAAGRRHAQREDRNDQGPPDPAGHRPEGGHGPVRLRAPLDREPGRGRRARGGALLAGDPALPGRMADDGDRRLDDPDRRPGGLDRPLRHRQHDQRHDARRPLAGDRPDGR